MKFPRIPNSGTQTNICSQIQRRTQRWIVTNDEPKPSSSISRHHHEEAAEDDDDDEFPAIVVALWPPCHSCCVGNGFIIPCNSKPKRRKTTRTHLNPNQQHVVLQV